jgi:hypothetical protein
MAIDFYGASNIKIELLAELDNFRSHRYPLFITSNGTTRLLDRIPVFSHHSIQPDTFETQLKYLKENGYRTITVDEYDQRNGETNGERVVMLTFDDGPSQLWTVGYPLLKKYGMKAVAFVLPGETKDDKCPRFTQDGELGGIESDEPLSTWPELMAMADHIDVQSHSLYHWIIYVSDRFARFLTPQILTKWHKIDLPIPVISGKDDFSRSLCAGAPMYEMDSRLSDNKRFFEPDAVRKMCERYVRENGNDSFFSEKLWNDTLTNVHDQAMESALWVMESDREQKEAIRHCFAESKSLLEGKLQKSVSHFCLPFGIGGRTALEMAKETGYKAVHWGVSPPEFCKEFPDINNVARIKDDYIIRLPGKGRRSLAGIFLGKATRRLGFNLFGWGGTR